jgi:membrane protein required for colicin V production
MQTYDIIMLVVLAATTFLGFRKGLAWQIASVAAIVVSYLVAVQFREVLAPRIDAEPPWNTFLAMLILYVGTSFVIWLVFQFVRGFIDRAKLHEFDHQLGAVFGLAKGVLLCVIITLFAVTLLSDDQRRQIIHSRSGLCIAQLLDRADAIMPEELHEFLHPYLHRLEGAPMRQVEGPDTADFRRLEDWLEGGQGGRRWRELAPVEPINEPVRDGRYGGPQPTPYSAEGPSGRSDNGGYHRR